MPACWHSTGRTGEPPRERRPVCGRPRRAPARGCDRDLRRRAPRSPDGRPRCRRCRPGRSPAPDRRHLPPAPANGARQAGRAPGDPGTATRAPRGCGGRGRARRAVPAGDRGARAGRLRPPVPARDRGGGGGRRHGLPLREGTRRRSRAPARARARRARGHARRGRVVDEDPPVRPRRRGRERRPPARPAAGGRRDRRRWRPARRDARVPDCEPRGRPGGARAGVRDLRGCGRRATCSRLHRRQPALRRHRAPHRGVPARLDRATSTATGWWSSCGGGSATSASSRARPSSWRRSPATWRRRERRCRPSDGAARRSRPRRSGADRRRRPCARPH